MTELRHKYLMAPLLTAAMVLLSGLLVAIPVLANPGLGVAGAVCKAEVVPGQIYTHTMTVGIRDTDAAMDIQVDVKGWGQSLEGIAQAVEPLEDTSPYSARSFITLDKGSFHLEPGDSQVVTATIIVPEDVGDGGRYAIIYVHSQPAGEGQVAIASAINTLVLLTTKDSQLVHEGKIAGVTSGESASGQPVEIFTTFQNTGNHHFRVKGEVTVSNAQSEILDTIHVAVSPQSVLPTMSKRLKAAFIPQGELPLGVYSIKSRVMLEDGTILDEAEGSFEVKEPYVPPPPPASLTITPGSAATLKTQDSRISISFPKGAVISQVEVSLRSYPLEQLPSPPTNFNLATTCFRIDGLTGLLLKEATVTVKYTPADLERAEGDASILRLARWDEAQSQWSVLKTKVDREAMTLSTSTNQFSLWAVMVAPPTVVNRVVIGGIMGGVIIMALVIYFLAVRRRGY